MSALGGTLREAARRGGGLITYLMGGDPDPPASLAYALACAEGGADVIELGVPFTDPIADGPAIQAAGQRARRAGVALGDILALAREVRAAGPPVVLMAYYNTIFVPGEEAFCRRAAAAGVDGLIVPDLPLEEAGGLARACGDHGLDLVLLVTPATGEERARRIGAASRGFLYLVSRFGVTGVHEAPSRHLAPLVARARRAAGDLPLAVGFGISRASHVAEVLALGADAAVVGSAVVERVARGVPPAEVRSFVASLRPPATPPGRKPLLPP